MSNGEPGPSMSTRELFGGAIALSLPSDYVDARFVDPTQGPSRDHSPRSDIRQIPDNQEVFLSNTSDTSVVVEVLAMVQHGEAGRDLAEAIKCAGQSHTMLSIRVAGWGRAESQIPL